MLEVLIKSEKCKIWLFKKLELVDFYELESQSNDLLSYIKLLEHEFKLNYLVMQWNVWISDQNGITVNCDAWIIVIWTFWLTRPDFNDLL